MSGIKEKMDNLNHLETQNGIPLSRFKNDSRSLSAILCYEESWSDGVYKTWGDFLTGTALLRRQIEAVKSDKWLLHSEDCWFFLLGFTALLQCKKEIILSSNVSPAYIAEIRNDGSSGGVPFFTDLVLKPEEIPGDVFYLPDILKTESADTSIQEASEPVPVINADETSIIMYTSGSTGQPKAVKHRLRDIENDYFFKIAEWGEDYLKRKICTTVSHHHFYGLSSAILMPFELGVPFRRKRIDFPEELEKLTGAGYAIFTVPAFLKRAVEVEDTSSFKLESPWILTSGGLLEYDLAKKTKEVLGFWPIEGFGSTETGGIAFRQSCNGSEWMPFKSIKMSQAEDGCLVVHLPNSKDPAGIKIADVVELSGDGRFLLKGRIDSVVKIEEKRISLPEIENRIMQSGLADDVCVISMEGNRQYLAAAIVFNAKGKEQFNGLEKNDINKYWRQYLSQYLESIVIPKKWRYLSALPVDTVGKKKKEDIRQLFNNVNLD